MPHEPIADFYFDLVDTGLIDAVFHDRGFRGPGDFIAYLQSERNQPVFIWRDNRIAGLAWLNPVVGTFALGHFCFRRSAWGEHAREDGKKVLDYWMALEALGEPILDVIIGATPQKNGFVHEYLGQIGMTRLGTVPGMFRIFGVREDAVIYYLSR